MSLRRRLVAAGATALLAWALAWGAGVPIPWHDAAATALRLSWVVRPERIETCRELSPEELAERPAHMRQRVECEGNAATYDLLVSVDGVALDSSVVRGAGVRGDRPIFLLREHPVAVGARRLEVRFARREPPDSAERSPRRGPASVSALALDTLVRFQRSAVVLVTVEEGALVVRAP